MCVGSSRSLGSVSTFEAADAVLFWGVIFADAVKSEHIAAVDASTRSNRQPVQAIQHVIVALTRLSP